MAWVNITKPTQGSATLKSIIDAVIDCLIYLYNLIGGSGGASDGVLNGSFENDTDGDGTPDSWVVTLFSGGSSGIYTASSAHGTKAYYFTSPGGSGKGGGSLTSESFIPCSEYAPVTLRWFHSSSVATVRNIVALLWYDKNKEACATAYTYLYDASTGNPTSWTPYIRGCTPPAGARYFKVWLCGCHNSDDTAGTTVFDDVRLSKEALITPSGSISENTTVGTSFADKGSMSIALPSGLSSESIVELSIIGRCKISNAAYTASQRFRVGTQYSDSLSTSSASYIYQGFRLLLHGATGAITLYQQLMSSDGEYTASGKVDAYSVVARIIQP